MILQSTKRRKFLLKSDSHFASWAVSIFVNDLSTVICFWSKFCRMWCWMIPWKWFYDNLLHGWSQHLAISTIDFLFLKVLLCMMLNDPMTICLFYTSLMNIPNMKQNTYCTSTDDPLCQLIGVWIESAISNPVKFPCSRSGPMDWMTGIPWISHHAFSERNLSVHYHMVNEWCCIMPGGINIFAIQSSFHVPEIVQWIEWQEPRHIIMHSHRVICSYQLKSAKPSTIMVKHHLQPIPTLNYRLFSLAVWRKQIISHIMLSSSS